jgi:hypothetical protein
MGMVTTVVVVLETCCCCFEEEIAGNPLVVGFKVGLEFGVE